MNVKRFLSGALCAVLLLALCPAAAADAPCEISSAEELSLLRRPRLFGLPVYSSSAGSVCSAVSAAGATPAASFCATRLSQNSRTKA